MKDIIKRRLFVTFVVIIPLVLLLFFISLFIYLDNYRNVTRQHKDLISQMRATEQGHLIRRVRMDLIGTLIIDIRVRSSAKDDEVLALVNEIKPLIEETIPVGSVNITLRSNFETFYGFLGRSREWDDSFEWVQHYPIP